jgi:hypothetical protein
MQPNPLLKKLGLSDDDRAVIIHADDVGMCQASLVAYADLVEFGLVSAASTMVPCPWFPATAAFCRAHPDDVDMGVHVTLTSEFEGYRWGPLSTRDPASGLLDPGGYFHAENEAVFAHGDADAVQREIEAQVRRALEAGIDVTHIDTHMGTVVHPRFLPAYIQAALGQRVPPLLLRLDEAGLRELGLDAESAALFVEQPDGRLEQIRRVLLALPPGVSYLIIHPAQDTPELRAIAPDWRGRVADFRAFTSHGLRAIIKDAGIHVIGWRVLRDLMRRGE